MIKGRSTFKPIGYRQEASIVNVCLSVADDFKEETRYNATVLARRWNDTRGFVYTPFLGNKTWCRLIDDGLNRINCGTLDVDPLALKEVSKTGVSSTENGNTQHILYCRKVNGNTMRCTKIDYHG